MSPSLTPPLDQTYAQLMKNHPYGTALHTPLAFRTFHPGVCGYFDAVGSWNPIADLSDPPTLSSQGYLPVVEELHRANPETSQQWGPKMSSSTKARRVGAEVGISGLAAAMVPVDLGAWYHFESTREGGAILLTKGKVRHERFYYESPFKAWVRDNAVGLITKRKEVLEYGLWVVTSTWATEECAINVWSGVGRGVGVGFKSGVVEIGELAPSGEWWDDGRDAGWIRAKALEGDDGRVVFFGGLRFHYSRIPFLQKFKAAKVSKSYRSETVAGGGQEELIEVEISGEEKETQAFAVHCEPVLETISDQDASEEEEEDGGWSWAWSETPRSGMKEKSSV